MKELSKQFWKETSKLIDAHRKNDDERAAQGVVDSRIVFNRLVKKLTLTDVSQQRELLLAWEEYSCKLEHITPNYEVLEENINDFLANNCG